MFIDWIHWLSSLHPEQLLAVLAGLLLIDAPRYALSQIAMCLWDAGRETWHALAARVEPEKALYCPSVCVVLAGYNEADTLGATLESLWGTYPRMELIVVDDGSTDGMAEVARGFARRHEEVLVLSRPERGGKSSALNSALPYTRAEVIITVDTDSHLGPGAIWGIVQPLADPRVGAVSGTVRVRNPFVNVVTWLQTYEYLQTIFLGRMLSSRLGLLAIISGAFGAFRRTVLDQVGAWDVGPGEDGDLTLRIRKSGFEIGFAPYAQAFTKVPTKWMRLYHQRRRWDRSVITFECRKHIDLAFPWHANFRWREWVLVMERWFFNVAALYGLWGYLAWLCFRSPANAGYVLFTLYCG
ncbi:MAG TPA: glycosyltransferase family 2 protein, partial [Pirellulales bacterium]|nr:glycosyltransferase family 2 protein [Pirellulales bacterium]